MKAQIMNCLVKYMQQQSKKKEKKEIKIYPNQYINILIKHAR